MTQEELESNSEENQEEVPGEETVSKPAAPERPPQIVEIRTPLDKPEFDWFLEGFMKKTGLVDKKQAAIMLTNMFYDMGLNPNDDLKELQDAMEQMNIIFKNLPNTPAALQVKDTMGAMYSAKAGRIMLDKMPKIGQNRSEADDRIEKIMDKYMPMIIAMKTMGQMMIDPTQQQPQQQQKTQAEVPPEVKKELEVLKSEFSEVKNLLMEQEKKKEQQEFATGLISTVNSHINPQIEALREQIANIANSVNALAAAQSAAPQAAPSGITEEIAKIKNDLKEAVDKIGEKAGAKSLTLDDLNPVLDMMDKLDKRFGKKEPEGEFNWKAATVSTIGEIGKEAISVGKEIMASRSQPAQTFTGQQGQPPAAPNEMQAIIKRQVQNYILQRLQTGATQMNIEEAAKELGLSVQQVNWAYNILVNEGWITTRSVEGSAAAPAAPTQEIPPAPPGALASQTNLPGGNIDNPSRRNENQPFIET